MFYPIEKAKGLNDLKDTSIVTPVDGQAPIYNSTSRKWENKQIVQKNQISNPNLLDNPWFTINQRGKVTYNTPWGMSVDRWRTDQDITLTVTSNGVQIVNSHATNYRNLYMQVLEEDYKNLVGRPITMSVMLSDGTIKSGTITAPPMATSQNEIYPIVDGGTFGAGMFTIYNQSPIAIQYYIGIPAGGTLNIRAVKIELGTVSTLGLDSSPNYETELSKCERYFVRYDSRDSSNRLNITGMVSADIDGNTGYRIIYLTASLPANIRTNPTVTLDTVTDWFFKTASSTGKLQSLYVERKSKNNLFIIGQISNDASVQAAVGEWGQLWTDFNPSNFIDFSADL